MKTLKLFTTILALLLAAASGFAASTFTVTNSGNVFTITRNDNTGSETVFYRTVSLSALAGQHYTAVNDSYTFTAGESSKTVTVTEGTPGTSNYRYQNGSARSYRFEVLDQGGFLLASIDRSITTGNDVSSSGVYSEKSATIQSGEFTVTDKGYNQTGCPYTISSTSYYNSTIKNYLYLTGAELRMTLSFQAKEVSDGYQYLQILVDNTTGYDSENDADKGNPGTPSLSRYMAGFEINTGSKDDTYRSYSFPVTSVANNAGATNPWGHGTSYPLSSQKFNTDCRATDGKLILPTNFSTLVVRFDASGSDSDNWMVKNLVAKITAVDGKAPTVLTRNVAPGRHSKGNTIYVSVGFNEIVNITGGTRKLSSNWGDLVYEAGSGTNVLTFKGTIPADATSSLNITGLTGTIADLAGNSISASAINANGLCSLTESFAFTITYDLDGGSVASANPDTYTWETATFTLRKPSKIGYVFAGWTGSNGGSPETTVTIAKGTHCHLSYTANWTQVWTGSGTELDPYVITTVEGMKLLSSSVNSGSNWYGSYFQLGSDISLSHTTDWDDTSSTEHNFTPIGEYHKPFQGTFDGNGYTISGIRIYMTSSYYVGLFGNLDGGTVMRVKLADARYSGNNNVGGIVGYSVGSSSILNCIATNVSITSKDYFGGVILGYNSGFSTITQNYYRNCSRTKGETTKTTDIGIGTSSSHGDTSGARSVHTLTLPANVTASGESVEISSTTYYASNTTVTLAYSGEIPAGSSASYTASTGSITGNTFTMPAADITVTVAVFKDDYITHWQAGTNHNGTSEAKAYVISTPEGLQLLSSEVLTGQTFEGVYFRLGNDIDMSGVANFTPIGIDGTYRFRGYFYGNHMTISNLTVNVGENNYAGLFGYASYGKIHSITLDCANITGGDYVGGIVGNSASCTVDYCTVTRSVITATSKVNVPKLGVIGGCFETSNSSFNDNKYHSTLVYAPNATGNHFHQEGDAFNIGYGYKYINIGHDSNGNASLDATQLFLPEDDVLRAKILEAYNNPSAHTAHGGSAPDVSAALAPNITSTEGTIFGEDKFVTTYYHSSVDYQLSEGAKAYTASKDGSSIVFHLVGQDGRIIPRNTAVIIVSDTAEFSLSTLTSTDVTAHPGNILLGTDTSLSKPVGTVYVLNKSGYNLGFYKFTGYSIPAHKAYYVVE